ncbi:MAG: hypothetical protein HYY96_14245 [Candidatus Tectomicrobia bacterium]|nr:hypothetical protein [Candidatus Tectomicrobia bacterium]
MATDQEIEALARELAAKVLRHLTGLSPKEGEGAAGEDAARRRQINVLARDTAIEIAKAYAGSGSAEAREIKPVLEELYGYLKELYEESLRG